MGIEAADAEADAAGWLALTPALAPEAVAADAAAPEAAPALPGNGGAEVPRPASDAKMIGVVRIGVCG